MRTIVNLPKAQIHALDAYGKNHGIPRAEVAKKAVAAFVLAATRKQRLQDHAAFGRLKKRFDSVEYIRRLRSDWVP